MEKTKNGFSQQQTLSQLTDIIDKMYSCQINPLVSGIH